ncbi:hypothetical protein B0O99DRAFT_512797 [Bisporella sp. PMI_857]|nr:hypothetical protein B0O99DRAFT_512797 [Bisporella sp. PMI_857]
MPSNNRGSNWGSQAGDWLCSSCGFSNFAYRGQCFRCRAERPITSASIIQKDNGILPSAILGPTLPTNKLVGSGKGLETSRFAPRNYHGQYKAKDIWTYVCASLNCAFTVPISNADCDNLPVRDLGLPYEVQHFILEMMRRILEEGSWGFAKRVVPEVILEYGYTCSEMVELAKWRDILPGRVPPAYIISIPGYTLLRGLNDAVKTRNAGSHRHLCSNTELRNMAKHSQNLMYMYGDVSRQNKFQWLSDELLQWDKDTGKDADMKRSKLEEALRLISEKPVGDMDWTPNSVSLEEITTENIQYLPYEEDDAMDID